MDNVEPQDLIKSDINKKSNLKTIIIIGLIIMAFSVGATYLYISNYYKLQSKNSLLKGDNICVGTKIIFFPGGNINDAFASIVYNGAKAAEEELGATVEYVWSDWDSTKMVSQLMDSISKAPDAIAIMGHPGSDALRPFIDEAERKNIIITTQNVDLPGLREKYSSNGFGYVGQSVYESGVMVSSAIVRKYNPKPGTEAIVFGVSSTTIPSRYQRTKGCVDGLKTGNVIVHEITVPKEIEDGLDSAPGEKMISDALARFPNTSIIIADHHYKLTNSLPAHLKNLGKNPGEIKVAGFDLSPKIVDGIKSGYIDLVLDQEPYLQGYLPILQACLTKKYGFAGMYVNTGVGLVDKSNIDMIAPLVEKKIR